MNIEPTSELDPSPEQSDLMRHMALPWMLEEGSDPMLLLHDPRNDDQRDVRSLRSMHMLLLPEGHNPHDEMPDEYQARVDELTEQGYSLAEAKQIIVHE